MRLTAVPRAPAWASCASRRCARPRRRRLRPAAARGARAGARALPAQPHEGELARDGPPPRLPRLRRRQALRRRGARWSASAASSASTPHRLPRQPARHPDPAPQGRRGPRARRLPARQPQREGAHPDPRVLPARRAVPDLGRRAVRHRHGHPAPGRAPARAAVRAPRRASGASSPAWSSSRATASTRSNRRRIETILREAYDAQSIDYTTRVSESVLVRLHYMLYGEPGHMRRARRRRDRAPDRRGHALVGRRPGRRRWSRSTGRSAATRCYRRYGDAFPTAYRADWVARSAVTDITRIESLGEDDLALVALPPARGARRAPCGPRCFAPARRSPSRTCCRCSRTWACRSPTSGPTSSSRATARRPGSTTSASPTRGRAPGRPDPRVLPGRLHPRLARRGRERRLQPSRPARAADRARDHGAARGRRATCARPAPPSAIATSRRRSSPIPTSRAADRALPRPLRPRAGRRARGREPRPRASSRRSTTSRASTRTASCATSSPSSRRCCAPTTSSPARAAPSPTCRSSSTPRDSPGCRCRARSSRSSSTRRASRACTCAAAGGSRRAALVGPPRGLPHRGPRADEGADGQERRDRAGGRQGRLRRQAPAALTRATCPRRCVACYRTFIRGLLDVTDNIGDGRDRPAAASRALRRGRPLPRRRRRQRHGHLLRRRERDLAASTASGSATPSPRAARAATTTRRWASPRAAPGSRSSATSASSGTTSRPRTSPSSGSETCRATCSATGCCSPRTSASSAPSTTATSSSTPIPTRRAPSRSESACSSCRARRGPTTT